MITLPEGLHGAHLRTRLHHHLGRVELRNAIGDGRLVSYSRTVLVQRERMNQLPTRAAAALLTAGPSTLLTSHTSAWLHGCTAAETNRIHLLIGYHQRHRARPGEAVHQAHHDPAEVAVLDGLRCLALEPTLAELLCRADRPTALACTDQALAVMPPDRRAEIKTDLAVRIAQRPDVRGRRRGLFLVDVATGLPESPAESALLLMVVDAGFPPPEPQHRVTDLDGREVWRIDFAWPQSRIALEYDGYAAHATKAEADEAREEDLRRRGWKVLRANASDLRNPTRLFRDLSAALSVPKCRPRRFWM
ncbi:hypothetical protein GCM10009634_21750 [Saccharothrix xinjiangensis]